MVSNLYNEITIIITLYQEKIELVKKCLKNIQNFKIIIVDNAGNKKLKQQIENEFLIFKYILNQKNVGWAKATNKAINLCDTEYALVFQADCMMNETNIEILLQGHRKYENCFFVSPTFYDESNNLTDIGGLLPENGENHNTLEASGDVCVESAIGSCMLFRTEDLVKNNLFLDENFFLYFVDFDFCRRIKKFNKSIIKIYNSKAIHVMGSIKVKNYFKKIYYRNYYYTLDELYYFYKIKKHHYFLKNLKNKILNYFLKILFNLFLFRIDKVVFYFSKIFAFYKFNSFLKNKKL